MPWIIGIDEAGYGPNLGPFVMTSVALRVPHEHTEADLWHVLRAAVRRHPAADDGRLLIEDSKVVYSTARGLLDLEWGVLAALPFDPAATLTPFVQRLCPAGHAELSGEVWFTGTSALPVVAETAACTTAGERLAGACAAAGVVRGLVRSVVVCPPRFNQLLDHWGSKGAVLAQGLAELVQCNRGLEDAGEPLRFFVDKHGGRNTYTAILQHALPDGMVVADEERLARSVYRVLGVGREVRLTFQPRADAEHFCVALASMVSKYLREVLMAEFNRFWLERVPGLKATAGYPGDAARFFAAIRPVLRQLGVAEEAVWRHK